MVGREEGGKLTRNGVLMERIKQISDISQSAGGHLLKEAAIPTGCEKAVGREESGQSREATLHLGAWEWRMVLP